MTQATHSTRVTLGQSTLTKEGRATIPLAARRVLGIAAGDRVAYIAVGDEVHVVSARSLVQRVWAQNHGGHGGDAVADVRLARQAEADAEVSEWAPLTDPDEDPDVAAARIAAALFA